MFAGLPAQLGDFGPAIITPSFVQQRQIFLRLLWFPLGGPLVAMVVSGRSRSDALGNLPALRAYRSFKGRGGSHDTLGSYCSQAMARIMIVKAGYKSDLEPNS
jgi:hypothetical protein